MPAAIQRAPLQPADRAATRSSALAAVADGKRLASEPLPQANVYETARLRRIERAAMETPTMAGYRWAPEGAGLSRACRGPPPLQRSPALLAPSHHHITLHSPCRCILTRRLLPKFTPGRAFFWGSVLALWGTGALVAGTARSLDIQTPEEATSRLRPILHPVASALEAWLAPLRSSLSIGAAGRDAMREDAQASKMVRRLRATLLSGSQ